MATFKELIQYIKDRNGHIYIVVHSKKDILNLYKYIWDLGRTVDAEEYVKLQDAHSNKYLKSNHFTLNTQTFPALLYISAEYSYGSSAYCPKLTDIPWKIVDYGYSVSYYYGINCTIQKNFTDISEFISIISNSENNNMEIDSVISDYKKQLLT